MIIRFVSLFATCFALHVLAVPAHAQQGPSLPLEQPPRPMRARTQAKLAALGFGGALIGVAGSAATGLVTGLIAYGAAEHEREAVALTVGALTIPAVACVAVPIASALFVQRAGRNARYRGRYGHALLGAGAGVALGVALGIALAAWKTTNELPAIGAVAGTVGVASAALLAMLAYRISDRRRARLSPVVGLRAAQAQLSIGLSGRF